MFEYTIAVFDKAKLVDKMVTKSIEEIISTMRKWYTLSTEKEIGESLFMLQQQAMQSPERYVKTFPMENTVFIVTYL